MHASSSFAGLVLRLVIIFSMVWSGAVRAADWVSLFNGRDLSGWVNVNGAPETWSVREGRIACTGFPTGALRTERIYENFELELEWRHLKDGGNAGIFLWSSALAAPGVPFLRSIEVQVLDHGYNAAGKNEWYTTHGDVFPIHGSSMQPFGRSKGQRSFPSEERSRPAPEWNHYHILASNGVVRVSVNGKEVSGGEACQWRRGYLGLESEGSPTEFRNVRMKELPSTGAGMLETAPAETGFAPLYNGVDLRGWAVGNEGASRWQASDWRLVLKDHQGQPGETLWSLQALGRAEYECIVDVRPPAGIDANAVKGGFEVAGYAVRFDSAAFRGRWKPGQWHRLRVVGRMGKRWLILNDIEIAAMDASSPAPSATKAFGLSDFGVAAEWANLYWRQ